MSADPKRYEIVSVADIFAIPAERFEAFLDELVPMVRQMRAINDMYVAVATEAGFPHGVKVQKMTWIDDAKREMTVRLLPAEEAQS